MSKRKKKPYTERTDIEKIKSNWHKIRGLYKREEWSSAVVRAATATEIAANFIIREKYIHELGLEPDLVDSFLRWANGIDGKFTRLILPALKDTEHEKKLKKLKKKVEDLNSARNLIVHSGNFKNRKDARTLVSKAHEIICGMVGIYYSGFKLINIDIPEDE